MNNLSSYCGLVDAKIRASDKDLPLQMAREMCHCTPWNVPSPPILENGFIVIKCTKRFLPILFGKDHDTYRRLGN